MRYFDLGATEVPPDRPLAPAVPGQTEKEKPPDQERREALGATKGEGGLASALNYTPKISDNFSA